MVIHFLGPRPLEVLEPTALVLPAAWYRLPQEHQESQHPVIRCLEYDLLGLTEPLELMAGCLSVVLYPRLQGCSEYLCQLAMCFQEKYLLEILVQAGLGLQAVRYPLPQDFQEH